MNSSVHFRRRFFSYNYHFSVIISQLFCLLSGFAFLYFVENIAVVDFLVYFVEFRVVMSTRRRRVFHLFQILSVFSGSYFLKRLFYLNFVLNFLQTVVPLSLFTNFLKFGFQFNIEFLFFHLLCIFAFSLFILFLRNLLLPLKHDIFLLSKSASF